jgi:hypothetical protein
MMVSFTDFCDEGVEGDVVVLGDWVVVVNRWDSNEGKKGDGCVVEEFVGGKVECTEEELRVWYLGVEVRLGSGMV